MTPPSSGQVDAALAALTGTVNEQIPGGDLDRNLLRLRLVAEAQQRGVTWRTIGAAMGLSGKAAKAQIKQLARHTQRQVLLAKRDG